MVKKNGGWTLLELMIVSGIIGMVVLIAPTTIKLITNFFILGKARLELQTEARAAMYLITRDLRQAQSATIVIDQVAGQPYYSRIRFTKSQGTTVSIYQSGTTLMMTHGIVQSPLSKNLAYLAFTFPRSDDMTIVSVSMTLKETIYGGATKALHVASERIRVMN